VRWIEAAGNQRTARTDASGTYRFDAVRPGEYFVIAVDSMQQWQMNDPEFLTEQQKRATRVAVGDVELPPLDLKVVR
jgi:protocatechuate 3,4-dioxygenase beta subunit